MARWRIVLIGAVCLLLAGGLYYFFKPEAPAPPAPVAPAASSDADGDTGLHFEGSTIVQQKDGKPEWELTAAQITVDKDHNIVVLSSVKGIFYRDDGTTINITAPRAVLNTQTKDIALDGGVEAISSDGAQFTAPVAEWQEQTRRFIGRGGVRYVRGDTVITGDTMTADNNLQHVQMQGNAHVVKKGE